MTAAPGVRRGPASGKAGAVLALLAALAAAGPATSAPRPTTASALEGAAALKPFFAALAELKSGRRAAPVQILQIGDSHTAADIIASTVRARLQARFGEAGRGLLPPGDPFVGYAPRQIEVTQSGGWKLQPSFPYAGGAFGLSGWRLTSQRPGASISLQADPEARFDKAVVCAMAGPGAGALRVSAGRTSARVSFEAAGPAPACKTVPLRGLHDRLELDAEGGPVTLFSIGAVREKGGVGLSNLGVSGTELSDFAGRDDRVLKAELQALSPQLIILAFGTNEGFRKTLDGPGYEAMAETQIRRLKSLAPGAAILVMGPPDADTVRPDIPEDGIHDVGFACAPLSDKELADYADLVAGRNPSLARWYPPPALAVVRAALRRAAAAQGAAFWDWSARMGGACSAHRLSRPDVGLVRGDHVHFTSDGGDMIGNMLSDDLLGAYDASQAGG